MSNSDEQLANLKQSKPPSKVEELAAIDLEIKKLELEAKKLELLERNANLIDIKERLADRELKRETRRQVSVTNGATLQSIDQDNIKKEKRCNHRKGGDGLGGIVGGKGTDPHYAILDHTFCHGDRWIRCLRCGKSWKPPVMETYRAQGHSEAECHRLFNKALAEYQIALEYPTNNKPSGSVVFRFSDNGDDMRKRLEPTTLR